MGLMTEAEKVSELHQDVKNNLINEDFEKVKNWQKDSYHKQMMGGFKETKEADEGFRKAQKPWAKKLKEVREPLCEHCFQWLGFSACCSLTRRSSRLPKSPTTWPAKRRSWRQPERPTARRRRR